MKFLAAAPKRNDELGLDQQIEMLAYALAGYVQMPAELV